MGQQDEFWEEVLTNLGKDPIVAVSNKASGGEQKFKIVIPECVPVGDPYNKDGEKEGNEFEFNGELDDIDDKEEIQLEQVVQENFDKLDSGDIDIEMDYNKKAANYNNSYSNAYSTNAQDALQSMAAMQDYVSKMNELRVKEAELNRRSAEIEQQEAKKNARVSKPVFGYDKRELDL